MPLSFEIFNYDPVIQKYMKICAWVLMALFLCKIVTQKQFTVFLGYENSAYYYLCVLLFSSLINGVAYGVLCFLALIVYLLYIEQILARPNSEQIIINSLQLSLISLSLINFMMLLIGMGYVYSDGYSRFMGITGHPSQTSQIASLSLIMLFYSKWKSELKLILSLICGMIVVSAGGKTIIFALTSSIVIVTFFETAAIRKYLRCMIILGIIAPYLLVKTIYLFEPYILKIVFLARSGNYQELMTLSGRVPLWEKIFSYLNSYWLTGVGFGGSKKSLPLLYQTAWGWVTDSAHNVYLHTFYEGGVISLAFLIILIWKTITMSNDKLYLAMLTFLLSISIVSSAYTGPGLSILMVILLTTWKLSYTSLRRNTTT